jgi:hypothetical protein
MMWNADINSVVAAFVRKPHLSGTLTSAATGLTTPLHPVVNETMFVVL